MRLAFPRGSQRTRKGIADGPVGELVDRPRFPTKTHLGVVIRSASITRLGGFVLVRRCLGRYLVHRVRGEVVGTVAELNVVVERVTSQLFVVRIAIARFQPVAGVSLSENIRRIHASHGLLRFLRSGLLVISPARRRRRSGFRGLSSSRSFAL